jgi:UDP-N-acetyl-D-glucosamine dehydrogenase
MDMRESPAVEIIELLLGAGASVEYADPHVPRLPRMRRHNLEMSAVSISEAALKEFDCVIVATDHDAFDYDMIRRSARLIVDSRGRYRDREEHIVSA